MTAQQELYDTTIIGGGPAGLYAAFYAGMRDMKTKIIEAQHQLGGKLLRYPKKMIWDVGGVTPIRAEHLVAQLIEQAMTFEPSVVLGQTITGLERLADGTYMLTAESGERHYTKTIIMGIGYGILKLAKLEIEGADRYEAANLHYSVQQLDIFRDKRVLISGGGDSAVDWANELEPLAASVTVVHRRDQFGGLERNVIRMMESSVDVRTPYAIESLHSEDGKAIRRVVVQQLETGATETLDVDAVIVNHGYKSDFGPLREWGLDIGDWDVTVGPGMETAQPGIFAAGDFVTYDNKVKLIAGTFTDAVLAVNSAKVYVEPAANRFGYVSSHNDKFKEKNRALGVEV